MPVNEDLLEAEVQQVGRRLVRAGSVLLDKLHGRLLENEVNLLERFVFGLGHDWNIKLARRNGIRGEANLQKI